MIPIEVLRRVSRVYTHKNCPDGMATAMILVDAFRMLGTSPSIEFLAHGTPEHTAAGRFAEHRDEVWIFCDIAPTYERSHRGSGFENSTVVLDHHKGVEELVRGFGEFGVFADEKLEPGVSGAVLAWRNVWAPIRDSVDERRDGERVADFAMCVGARDTWQTEDVRFHRGQWISKFLMSKPKEYFLEQLIPYGQRGEAPDLRLHLPYLTEEEVAAGAALFDAHEQSVRQAVEQCVWFEVQPTRPDGWPHRLAVFQEQASGFRLCSDVAESIRQVAPVVKADVVAGFSYVVDKPGDDPKLLYSLRGLNGFDVAAFAKANGGGGHTAAAGFSRSTRSNFGGVVMTDPYHEIREALSTFLVSGAGTST